MDGAAFSRAVKANPKFETIPVVILTADGNLELKIRTSGALDGLNKPIDVDVLLDTVELGLNASL